MLDFNLLKACMEQLLQGDAETLPMKDYYLTGCTLIIDLSIRDNIKIIVERKGVKISEMECGNILASSNITLEGLDIRFKVDLKSG